jgi:hypothetical protein
MIMTKFGRSEKSDHRVSYSETFGFDTFRLKPRNELKLKI